MYFHWINVYLYFSRLRFDSVDENNKPIETLSYADRILAENAGQSSYQSPSYKDSFLRQYQTNDFQQRTILCYLRTNILNLLHTLYVDPSINKTEPASPTPAIHMPDEQVFNALKTILNDFDKCTKYLTSSPAITPCELQSINELELYKSIPLFIQILLDGLILNKPTEAASTIPQISLSNTTIHYDKIEQYINGILKQLERSYQTLLQRLENTSFQKRCQDQTSDEPTAFLHDLSGNQSPLEYYSVYTEFISYIYSLYLSIKSILATLFNKTSLLIDTNENPANRSSNPKKSKKKSTEQQTSSNVSNENENEIKLWNQLDKIEHLFNDQWIQITDNIKKYELYLRSQGQLTDDECDKLEKELDGNSEQQSNKSKTKSDENNNESLSSTKENDDQLSFQLGKVSLRSSTIHIFAIGYLESLIQIRVCLTSKQKTLRFRQSST